VWLPPAVDARPETRAGYTLAITSGVHRGPAKHRTRDLMGNLVEGEVRYSLHLLLADPPAGMPWLPVREKTTLLVGTALNTAACVRITDFEDLAGRLELQVEIIPAPFYNES